MSQHPFIIPLFIPHAGCPHRCIFCNQDILSATGKGFSNTDQLLQTVDRFLSYRRPDRKPAEIAFYGGNFLGLPPDQCNKLLQWSATLIRKGKVTGIRFSTRPDTIDSERLAWLSGIKVCAVELGAQSMDETILEAADRGHSVSDTVEAVGLLKSRHLPVGLQLMVGLPGETATGVLRSAERIAELSPDFVRIYPTVVLSGSRLAIEYKKGTYRPLTLEAALQRVKPLVRLFGRRQIPIVRIGLQADKDLDSRATVLAGPYHPAFGEMVYSALFLDQARAHLEKYSPRKFPVHIRVHPKNLSKMLGNRKANKRRLEKSFGEISVQPDVHLASSEICIEKRTYSIYDNLEG